jgi:hypothetical protein
MGDSFQGVEDIVLQPGSDAVPYQFIFAACSSSTANDGSIPNGTTISSGVIKAFDEAGDDVTTEMVDSESNTSLVQTIWLKYPASSGAGRYSLEMILTLSSAAVMEFDFTRVYAKDITA